MAYFKYIIFLISFLICNNTPAKELNVWIMPNGANSKGTLEKLLEPYEKATGHNVNVTVLDWGVAWNKITTNLANQKNAPNIVQLGTTWIGHFESLNQLSVLNGKIQHPKRFFNSFIELSHIHNKVDFYSVPFFSDTRVFFANKKYLDSIGVSPNINTYSEFIELLQKIKRKNFTLKDGTVVTPYSFPGKQDWNIPHNFAPWIWSNGGKFINFKNGKWQSALLEEGTIIGVQKYINFVLHSLANNQTLQENSAVVSQRFIRGETAIIYSTSEIIKKMSLPVSEGGLIGTDIWKDSLYVLNVPAGSSGSITFSGGSHLAIPKKFEDDKATFSLLHFLTSSDIIQKYNDEIGFFPPDTTLWNSKTMGKDMMRIIPMAKTSKSYPQIAEWGAVEAILIEYFSEVWSLVESNYSPEFLYEKTKIYDDKINKLFNNSVTSNTTMEQFTNICDSLDCDFSSSHETKTEGKRNFIAEINTYFGFNVVPYLAVFFVVILLLIIFIKRM